MWDNDSMYETGNDWGTAIDVRESRAFAHAKQTNATRHRYMDPYASTGPNVRAIQVTHTGNDCCCDSEEYSKECPLHSAKAKDHTIHGNKYGALTKPEKVGGRRPIDEATDYDGMHDHALRFARRHHAASIPSRRLMPYHNHSNFDATQYQ